MPLDPDAVATTVALSLVVAWSVVWIGGGALALAVTAWGVAR